MCVNKSHFWITNSSRKCCLFVLFFVFLFCFCFFVCLFFQEIAQANIIAFQLFQEETDNDIYHRHDEITKTQGSQLSLPPQDIITKLKLTTQTWKHCIKLDINVKIFRTKELQSPTKINTRTVGKAFLFRVLRWLSRSSLSKLWAANCPRMIDFSQG